MARQLRAGTFLVVLLAAATLASAQEQTLYAVNGVQDILIKIDPATGAGQAVGELGIDVQNAGLDFACDGTLWGLSQSGVNPNEALLYTIDLFTGAATVVQTFDLTGWPTTSGLAFGPDEATLYWRAAEQLNILDPVSGTVTSVTTGISRNGAALTPVPGSCSEFYSMSRLRLILLDPTDGSEAGVGNTGIALTSLAADNDGVLYGHDSRTLYEISTANGQPTPIGFIGFAAPGMSFGPLAASCVDPCPFCPVDPSPEGQGYWHRQCLGLSAADGGIDPGSSGRGPGQPTEPGFAEGLVPCAEAWLEELGFSGTTTCEGMDADPAHDACEKALKQLTALALNVCSGRLKVGCPVEVAAQGCSASSVGELLTEAAGLLRDGECASSARCVGAVLESEP